MKEAAGTCASVLEGIHQETPQRGGAAPPRRGRLPGAL